VSAPIAQTVTGTNTVCIGSTTTFSSTTTGGTWTSATPAVATVNASTGVITGVTAGTSVINYSVTTAGGCINTGSRTVTVSAPVNAGTISGTQGICVGGTTTFFSNGNTGGIWSSNLPGIASVNASTGVISGIAAGTAIISYTVTGTGGCANATVTRTVTVYAPTVTLTGTTSIAENSGSSTPITATLSTATISDVLVTISYSGTAISGSDYTANSTTITIPSGSTTGTVTITPINDNINEGSETVIANIDNVTGGCATESGNQSATVTIIDDDNASTVLAIADSSANEGSNVVFNFTLSNPSSVATTYLFNLTNGTAGDLDYTTTSVTVNVPAGATTGTVSVPTTQDTIDELNETFRIAIGTVNATGTILDDDNAPTVTIGDAIIAEGGILSFPVSLSNPSATDITVTLGFTNVSTANGDYTTTPVVVTFLAGATTATATVATTEDPIAESTETFTVGITSTTGTVGSTTDTATGTITDNDNAPTVTIGDAIIAEGGILSFPVSLSNPSATDITVTLGFTNVSTANGDYTTTPVVVTFLAGATTATATVATTEDPIAESTETFTVGITSTTGTVGSTTDTATGTITDNDNAPTVTIGDAIIAEGGILSFPVSLSNPSATDITVTLGFTNVSTANGDYT
ncbi:beta strand repeat-containing protein, partial [Flavobacterium petrolei]|uniref:beta strand repeat-containing protein n=1 Tax=Flavobacterium petrolei TaxID=2259594 RepID=UPI0037565432